MSDDWRIRATLTSDARAAELGDLLNQGGVDHELATAAGDRVVVSVDDHEVFLYASSREQAERGSEALGKLAGDRGWEITRAAPLAPGLRGVGRRRSAAAG